MFTSSLFFISRNHTEFLVIIFDHPENRSSTLVWETVVWSVRKKSTLFYTHNNFRKNYSFNASWIEKIHWNIVKIKFSCGNYRILCSPESQTKDHNHGPRTIEHGRLPSNYKQNAYVWNLQLSIIDYDYREEHKSYLQGVFQIVTIWLWQDIHENNF